MKKVISLIMTGIMIFALTACGSSSQSGNATQNTEESSREPKKEEQTESKNSNEEQSEETKTSETEGQNDILVVYFSQTGNTEMIANMIAEHTGSTVIPFCTHEGSALGRSERDIAKLIPEAELLEGLAVRGSNVDSAEDDVVDWLEGLGFDNPKTGE